MLFSLALFLFLFLSTPILRAEIASPAEMDQVCENWLTAMTYELGQWAGDMNPQIRAVDDLYVDGTVLARLYSIEPMGYVLVPALKELPPVKAYADDCNLDVNDTGGLVDLFRVVLRNRAEGFIANYGSLDAVQDEKANNEHRALWDVYTLKPEEFISTLG